MVQNYIDEAYGCGKQRFTAEHPELQHAQIATVLAKAKHYQPIETPAQLPQ
jgi:hypothetical protein